jgi:hypothetical protein
VSNLLIACIDSFYYKVAIQHICDDGEHIIVDYYDRKNNYKIKKIKKESVMSDREYVLMQQRISKLKEFTSDDYDLDLDDLIRKKPDC